MQEFLICAVLYLILGIIDLYPLFKRKQWSYLYFSIPVYAVTFVVSVYVARNGMHESLTLMLEKLLSVFVN